MSKEPTLQYETEIVSGITADGIPVMYASLKLTAADARAMVILALAAQDRFERNKQEIEAAAAAEVARHFSQVAAAVTAAGKP